MRVTKFLSVSTAMMVVLAAQPARAQTNPQDETVATTAETAPEPAGDEIIVTGLRRSLESSQTIKQNADQIVDAIVAEDIGKLPDITASASLARITGVQVGRAAGEAADVRVRGLPDLSTTYNGREIFTAEGRNVALQDFPAGGVAALEVYKSSTANLIEAGIAGQINVRSRKPFDFKGLQLFGSFNGVLFDSSQALDYNANLLFSNRWDTGIGEIGLLINASVANTDFLDSTREQSLVIGRASAAQSPTPGFRFPDAQAIFHGQADRVRPSVNTAVQWKPTPELEIYADGLFQGFRSRDADRFLFVPLFGAGIRFTDVILQEGTNLAQSLTATGGVRPDGFQQSRDAETDTYQVGGGAIWRSGGLRLSADVAYTDSKFTTDQLNLDYAFASTPARDVNFDGGPDGGPVFSFRNFDVTDPRNFIIRGLFERISEAKGDDIQVRGDVEYDTDLGFLRRLQAGVRFNDRDASRRVGTRDTRTGVEARRLTYLQIPVELEAAGPAFRDNPSFPVRTFITPTADSIRDNADALRTLLGTPLTPIAFDPLETFTAGEKAYAGYAQLKYEFDIGIPVDGVVGLRAIRTETTVNGTARNVVPNPAGPGQIVTFAPVSQTNKRTDYLPNVSARFKLVDKLQLRAAYTETRTLPNFDQLNPSLNFGNPSAACDPDNPNIPNPGPNNPNCVTPASGGNPDLRPLKSRNYDLSLEYYFSRRGSLVAAAFRRDVNGFISRFNVTTVDPVFGRLNINRPNNGGDGRLQGIELAVATFFDFGFLPEWARNFGIQANYSYIDNGSELPPNLAANLPAGADPRQRIPGVSKHTYNIVALYERPEFSARLAYNYRSSFVDFFSRENEPGFANPNGTFGRDPGPVLPLIEDGRGVLDFSATVTPTKNVTVAFDVANILGEPVKASRAFDETGASFPRRVRYLERVFSLGVRVRY